MIALRTIRQLSQISVILLACLSHSWHVYAFEEESQVEQENDLENESPVEQENDLENESIYDENINDKEGANTDDSAAPFNEETATLKEVIEGALSQDVTDDVDIAGDIAEMSEESFMSLLDDLSTITADGLSDDDRSILEAIQNKAKDFDITLSNIQELLDATSPPKFFKDVIGGAFSDVSKDNIDNMSDDTFRSLLDEIDETDLSAITVEDLSDDDIRSLEAIQSRAKDFDITLSNIQELLEEIKPIDILFAQYPNQEAKLNNINQGEIPSATDIHTLLNIIQDPGDRRVLLSLLMEKTNKDEYSPGSLGLLRNATVKLLDHYLLESLNPDSGEQLSDEVRQNQEFLKEAMAFVSDADPESEASAETYEQLVDRIKVPDGVEKEFTNFQKVITFLDGVLTPDIKAGARRVVRDDYFKGDWNPKDCCLSDETEKTDTDVVDLLDSWQVPLKETEMYTSLFDSNEGDLQYSNKIDQDQLLQNGFFNKEPKLENALDLLAIARELRNYQQTGVATYSDFSLLAERAHLPAKEDPNEDTNEETQALTPIERARVETYQKVERNINFLRVFALDIFRDLTEKEVLEAFLSDRTEEQTTGIASLLQTQIDSDYARLDIAKRLLEVMIDTSHGDAGDLETQLNAVLEYYTLSFSLSNRTLRIEDPDGQWDVETVNDGKVERELDARSTASAFDHVRGEWVRSGDRGFLDSYETMASRLGLFDNKSVSFDAQTIVSANFSVAARAVTHVPSSRGPSDLAGRAGSKNHGGWGSFGGGAGRLIEPPAFLTATYLRELATVDEDMTRLSERRDMKSDGARLRPDTLRLFYTPLYQARELIKMLYDNKDSLSQTAQRHLNGFLTEYHDRLGLSLDGQSDPEGETLDSHLVSNASSDLTRAVELFLSGQYWSQEARAEESGPGNKRERIKVGEDLRLFFGREFQEKIDQYYVSDADRDAFIQKLGMTYPDIDVNASLQAFYDGAMSKEQQAQLFSGLSPEDQVMLLKLLKSENNDFSLTPAALNHVGIELHNHYKGVLPADYFVKRIFGEDDTTAYISVFKLLKSRYTYDTRKADHELTKAEEDAKDAQGNSFSIWALLENGGPLFDAAGNFRFGEEERDIQNKTYLVDGADKSVFEAPDPDSKDPSLYRISYEEPGGETVSFPVRTTNTDAFLRDLYYQITQAGPFRAFDHTYDPRGFLIEQIRDHKFSLPGQTRFIEDWGSNLEDGTSDEGSTPDEAKEAHMIVDVVNGDQSIEKLLTTIADPQDLLDKLTAKLSDINDRAETGLMEGEVVLIKFGEKLKTYLDDSDQTQIDTTLLSGVEDFKASLSQIEDSQSTLLAKTYLQGVMAAQIEGFAPSFDENGHIIPEERHTKASAMDGLGAQTLFRDHLQALKSDGVNYVEWQLSPGSTRLSNQMFKLICEQEGVDVRLLQILSSAGELAADSSSVKNLDVYRGKLAESFVKDDILIGTDVASPEHSDFTDKGMVNAEGMFAVIRERAIEKGKRLVARYHVGESYADEIAQLATGLDPDSPAAARAVHNLEMLLSKYEDLMWIDKNGEPLDLESQVPWFQGDTQPGGVKYDEAAAVNPDPRLDATSYDDDGNFKPGTERLRDKVGAEESPYKDPREGGHVLVRFGHVTHITAEQCQRLARLGIWAEVNIGSNLISGAMPSIQGAADRTTSTDPKMQRLVMSPLLNLLYEEVPVVLSTDGQGVMDTNVPLEYHYAQTLIDAFKSGTVWLNVFDGTYDDDGKPNLIEKKWTDLVPDEQARFDLSKVREASSEYRQLMLGEGLEYQVD